MGDSIVGEILLEQFRVDAFIRARGTGAGYKVWDLKRNVPLVMRALAKDPGQRYPSTQEMFLEACHTAGASVSDVSDRVVLPVAPSSAIIGLQSTETPVVPPERNWHAGLRRYRWMIPFLVVIITAIIVLMAIFPDRDTRQQALVPKDSSTAFVSTSMVATSTVLPLTRTVQPLLAATNTPPPAYTAIAIGP